MNNITNEIKIYFSQIDDSMNESERRYEGANKDACSFVIKKLNCTSIPIHSFSIQSKVIVFLLIKIIISQIWMNLTKTCMIFCSTGLVKS